MTLRFLQSPKTFEVEEVPLYPPSGRGGHLFLTVRKSGISTPALVGELCRRLRLKDSEVGAAGNKDRDAVATQTLSVPARAAERAEEALKALGVELLVSAPHEHKLRMGHLRGNRFHIRLLAEGASDVEGLRAAVRRAAETGMPNAYGPQRFGDGSAVEEGRLLFLGRRPMSRFRRSRFAVSAFQSHLFNRVLEERLSAGAYPGPLDGDLMVRHDSGGIFPAPELTRELEERVRALEISPTGPLPGKKAPLPTGSALRIEREILVENGVDPEEVGRLKPPGARRALRVPIEEITLEGESPTLEGRGVTLDLRLFLPPGSYATVLLSHLGVSLDHPRR